MIRTLTRRAACAGIAAALLAGLTGSIADAKEVNVKFKRGGSTASYTGKVPRTDVDYDAYILRARAGQTLSFSLESADRDAHVIVYAMELGPTEDRIAPSKPEAPRLRRWSGKLPVAGGYSVQVYGKRPGAAYAVRIGVR